LSEGTLKPLIIPIFIPNAGCPHRCIFCDQERITSQHGAGIGGDQIREVLNTAINAGGFDVRRSPEVAFFGGTFSSLPKDRMRGLLDSVMPYIGKGYIRSIRVSTRPDCLDNERLEIMKTHGVETVELGAQSMDDEVLSLSHRGHTAQDTVRAVHALKAGRFRVGIQLMPGLPGDSEKKFRATISKVIDLCPDMVRLYPALVIRGTGLEGMYREGRYCPLSLQKGVEICVESCIRLETNGIPVIRIGLMSSPTLLEKGQIVSGPWHPAFGFLVRSAIHEKKIRPDLPGPGGASELVIFAPKREIPLVRGFRNRGLRAIEAKTGARVVGVRPDDTLPAGTVRIEKI